MSVERDRVPCTIWMKQADGKWLGRLCLEDGEITRAGKKLIESFKTSGDVEKLLASLDGEASGEFKPVCGDSLMQMQAREWGGYCYVFENSRWMLGARSRRPLEPLLKWMLRND